MPSVKFHIKKKTAPANLYVRFIHKNIIDRWATTDVLINPEYWDAKGQRLKKTKATPNAVEINNILNKLKAHIIDKFTITYSSGQTIDSVWLKKTVRGHFNRPVHEVEEIFDNTAIYFTDFMQWWMDNKKDTFRNPRSKKRMSEKRKGYFQDYVTKLVSYEKHIGYKIKLADLTPDKAEDIMAYFDVDQQYGKTMVEKLIGRHNFFLDRAIEENRTVPRNCKCIYEPKPQKEVLEPYLNEQEIEQIFNHDFSNNEKLDNARDNFIIGLWTGLRVSDFLSRLNIDNIKDDIIEIQTQKTKTNVAIPLHPMIQETLNKRLGMLPSKISDQKFNKHIKKICEQVGINKDTEGYLEKKITLTQNGVKKRVKRKVLGIHPKYKLVSSHICRRSFTTNLYGKIPNYVLQGIGGWSTERMMLRYLKRTSLENAKVLKAYWDKEYAPKKIEEPKNK